jgi:hypothetical protein
MKALSLTALLSWILCHAWAQTSHTLINLKGTVTDSATGKPMAFATLVLQNAKTKAPVKNFISKEDGSFEFSVTDSLDWLLVIAFTGYDNKTIPIIKGKSEDLGQISLKASGKQMNNL